MKTFSEWIASVKDASNRQALENNVPKEKLNTPASSLRIVVNSFSWSGSKERWEHWNSFYHKLVAEERDCILSN